jgi:hypothetical protein
MMLKCWIPDWEKTAKELLWDSSFGAIMITSDLDIDWSNNEEVIADTDNDKGGGQECEYSDLSIEINRSTLKKRRTKVIMHMTFLPWSKYCFCA